jgi:hypothetical protein
MITIEAREPDEPHVGIFWLLENKLIIDSTPLSSAALYGDCCTHDGGHIDVCDDRRPLSVQRMSLRKRLNSPAPLGKDRVPRFIKKGILLRI